MGILPSKRLDSGVAQTSHVPVTHPSRGRPRGVNAQVVERAVHTPRGCGTGLGFPSLVQTESPSGPKSATPAGHHPIGTDRGRPLGHGTRNKRYQCHLLAGTLSYRVPCRFRRDLSERNPSTPPPHDRTQPDLVRHLRLGHPEPHAMPRPRPRPGPRWNLSPKPLPRELNAALEPKQPVLPMQATLGADGVPCQTAGTAPCGTTLPTTTAWARNWFDASTRRTRRDGRALDPARRRHTNGEAVLPR